MKQKLMRPTAALFPLAGGIAALAGNLSGALYIFLFYYGAQLFSLCVADCFRNAAAREPGVRRVDRRFSGAAAQLLAGIALMCVVLFLTAKESMSNPGAWCAVAAASLISIEQLFEERMYALARPLDGAILSAISNGLLLTGLLLDSGKSASGSPATAFAAGGAALAALIAAATTYAVEPAHGFSLKLRNLPFAPVACLQTLLYPAACAAWFAVEALLLRRTDAAPRPWPSFFAGLVLWRLARTLCRRAQDESRPLNLLLTALAAAAISAAAQIPQLLPCAIATELALLCAAALFCAPSIRLYTGLALTLAALALTIASPLPANWNALLSIACAAAAPILNLKRAFLRRV